MKKTAKGKPGNKDAAAQGKGKKRDLRVTKEKYRKLIRKISEELGPKTMGQILLEMGFKQSVADSPGVVLNTQTFQDIMNEQLPDVDLIPRHRKLLDAGAISTMQFDRGVADDTIRNLLETGVPGCKLLTIEKFKNTKGKIMHKTAYYRHPDNKAVKAGLDMAYKLKGKYKPQEVEFGKETLKAIQDTTQKLFDMEREKAKRAIVVP